MNYQKRTSLPDCHSREGGNPELFCIPAYARGMISAAIQ